MPFYSTTLSKWSEIRDYVRHAWLYRGQGSADWPLTTSLERCCDRLEISQNERRETEDRLFREFRRAYHDYAHYIPPPSAVVEWLTLMQHHGAPTRLLDFTYSIYIAAYFAVETADGDSVVWAVNGLWAMEVVAALLRAAGKKKDVVDSMVKPFVEDSEEKIQELFFSEPYVPAAWPINPFRLNERLRIQRGVSLITGDVSKPFMDNLQALPKSSQQDRVIRIVIPHAERRTALQELFSMGITRASLFPGLDGYARSLGVYSPAFDPVRWRT